jgi:hypothetical protein
LILILENSVDGGSFITNHSPFFRDELPFNAGSFFVGSMWVLKFSLGLKSEANYASFERTLEELEYAEKIMKWVGCPIINVSNKAVEETAGLITDVLKSGRG